MSLKVVRPIETKGRATLAENLASLNVTYLKQFPEFLEYYTGKKPEEAQGPEPPDVGLEFVKPAMEQIGPEEWLRVWASRYPQNDDDI